MLSLTPKTTVENKYLKIWSKRDHDYVSWILTELKWFH